MNNDYDRIADAIRYITAHRLDQPDLDAVATHVGLSPYHFQRLFSRWAGVSPKRFLGFLTVQHARALLAQDASVLDTALDVGLSGPSRLHDLFVSFEAMTPGEAKNGGANLTITYSVLDTPFGPAVALSTPKGICGLEFIEPGEDPRARAQKCWPGAHLTKGFEPDLAKCLFAPTPQQPIHLHLKGTNFQIQVWQALMRIAPGHLTTYKRIAERVCSAKAARAVGGAIGANPVAVLIPCHRVIKESGVVEGYRWGSERKRALIAWEGAHEDPQEHANAHF